MRWPRRTQRVAASHRGVAWLAPRQIDVPPIRTNGRMDERARIGHRMRAGQRRYESVPDTHRSRADTGRTSSRIRDDNLCTATVPRTTSSVRACVRKVSGGSLKNRLRGIYLRADRAPPRRRTARSCCCFDTFPGRPRADWPYGWTLAPACQQQRQPQHLQLSMGTAVTVLVGPLQLEMDCTAPLRASVSSWQSGLFLPIVPVRRAVQSTATRLWSAGICRASPPLHYRRTNHRRYRHSLFPLTNGLSTFPGFGA